MRESIRCVSKEKELSASNFQLAKLRVQDKRVV